MYNRLAQYFSKAFLAITEFFSLFFSLFLSSAHWRYIGLGIVLCLGLQLMNVFLLMLLGLHNHAYTWSFLSVLYYGFTTPVLIAFGVVFTPIIAGILWFLGGPKRNIAYYAMSTWLIFMIASWLAIYVFIVWDKISVPAYPWLIYRLFLHLPENSMGLNRLIYSVSTCYAIAVLGIFFKFDFFDWFQCFSSKAKAQKVFGAAHFACPFEIQKAGLFNDTNQSGIVLGKAYGKKLKLSGFESVLVVAPTGSGKTTAIAVPNLLEWKGSGVFNDLKGELYKLTACYRREKLQNKCLLWAPANEDMKTYRYNPFYYVSDNPNLRIRDLQLIAETLIPATKLGDGFWYQSSREIFLTLALYLFEKQGMATLAEIHDLSKKADFAGWLIKVLEALGVEFSNVEDLDNEFNEEIMVNGSSKFFIQNAFAFLSADEKTRSNILKDFHSRMNLFNDPIVRHATSGNDFDFRNLRKEKMSIYVQIPDADKERLTPILTLFWAQLINTMSAKEPGFDEPYGVLALMDEFGNMARINKLKDGMSFMRSYHMRCIIVVQYLSQITSVYGRDDAKGFLNSKVKLAFALNDFDDAQFFSKALGTKTVKVISHSVNTGYGDNHGSKTQSNSFQSRALMTPDKIMQMKATDAIILIEAKNPIKAKKCYWFRDGVYRQMLSLITENEKICKK